LSPDGLPLTARQRVGPKSSAARSAGRAGARERPESRYFYFGETISEIRAQPPFRLA
jgi:hypothetical protein